MFSGVYACSACVAANAWLYASVPWAYCSGVPSSLAFFCIARKSGRVDLPVVGSK